MSASQGGATAAGHTRRLSRPFAVLFGLGLVLQVAFLVAVLMIAQVRERNRATVAVAQSLHGLVEEYESATYLALVGLSVSDWEMLLRNRSLAKSLTEQLEQKARALRSGGSDVQGEADVILSGVAEPEIDRALEAATRAWRELEVAQVRVLRSDDRTLKGNPAIEEFQSLSLEVNQRMRALEERIQRSTDAEIRWLDSVQRAIPIGAFTLNVLLSVLVFYRLLVPLGTSITRLEESEGELRTARDHLELRVNERTAELQRANEDLREQTEVLDSVLQNMGDAVVVVDAAGQITLFNASASTSLGIEAHDGRAATVSTTREFFRPDGVTPFAGEDMPVARVIRGESLDQVEVFSRDREQPTGIWLSITARPLHGPDHALRGAVAVLRDVTLSKQAEQALRRTNEELESRVEERTRELKEVQLRALDLARLAGMTEVATNVLHNVGNVLNSVNTSAALLNEQLRASRLPALGKAAAMLKEHRADLAEFLTRDERGRNLPTFLDKLGEHLLTERDEMLAVTTTLNQHVEHIRAVVNLQQSYAKTTILLERVSLSDLVEDALRINASALVRHEVVIDRQFAALPPLFVDKHKVLQIVLNLISNAKYAFDGSAIQDRRITLRIERRAEGPVRIQVSDNGMGIAPDVLPRIFQHGFTTRTEGHGFGLHSCALAARAIDGSLVAHSDGSGRGATFTLELPYRAEGGA
ncbi:MAG: sensor histidine kinase [Byssovorax sp.]